MSAERKAEFTIDQLGFIQAAPVEVLAAAVRGAIDLNQLAREELAKRGLDKNGSWVGFAKARIIHNI